MHPRRPAAAQPRSVNAKRLFVVREALLLEHARITLRTLAYVVSGANHAK